MQDCAACGTAKLVFDNQFVLRQLGQIILVKKLQMAGIPQDCLGPLGPDNIPASRMMLDFPERNIALISVRFRVEDTVLEVRSSRRKTHDLLDEGETTKSSHQLTDEVESEMLEESKVSVGSGKTSHRNHNLFLWDKGRYRHVRIDREMWNFFLDAVAPDSLGMLVDSFFDARTALSCHLSMGLFCQEMHAFQGY